MQTCFPDVPTMPRRIALLVACLLCRTALAMDAWTGPDKALHFSVSAGIAAGGYAGTALLTDDEHWRLGMGAGLALVAGAGKELYDLTGRGDPSWKDFTWDAIGTLTGVGLGWVLDHFIFHVRRWGEPLRTPAF